MNEYYFFFKNSLDRWDRATNPVFIAKHTYCRAVKKDEFDSLNFGSLSKFINLLNEEDFTSDKKVLDFINTHELY